MRITNTLTSEQFVFKTRYSDLRNIAEALDALKVKGTPKFPKRKIFSITNESPEDIERRREELVEYFNQVLRNPELASSPVIRFFIADAKRYTAQ
jgi:hypothetical protein